MARVPDPVWQPPSVPWATKKSVWVDDGDGGTDEVSVHSPRLQRASKETGVPLSEVAVRKKASFKEHGLRREVVATRFQMFEQRRMEKLWLLVRRRARLVQEEERAKELAKEKAKDFQVEAPPAGPSMMERAQQRVDAQVASAAHRAEQAARAQAQSEALVEKRAEAQAERDLRSEQRAEEREREVAKKRRAALREERKRRQKKVEEAALEAEQDALVLQEFQEREVQLEAAMAVRLEKYEARRKRGLRAQARVQARVERRQVAAQVAKEKAMVEADAKALAQAEKVRIKNEEAHERLIIENEKKAAEQAVRLEESEQKIQKAMEAQRVLMLETERKAQERLALAKERQIARVEEKKQRRLDLAARKRDRQRVVAGAVIRLKEEAAVRAVEKEWLQEELLVERDAAREIKAERNRMRLENKFDEVRRLNRQKEHEAAAMEDLIMEKDRRTSEHIAMRQQVFDDTRQLVLAAQFEQERTKLEESLSQWRPTGGRAKSAEPASEGSGSESGSQHGGGGLGIGRSKSQTWASSRLTAGAPFIETASHRKRMEAFAEPNAVAGRRREAQLNAFLDFKPKPKTLKSESPRHSPRCVATIPATPSVRWLTAICFTGAQHGRAQIDAVPARVVLKSKCTFCHQSKGTLCITSMHAPRQS
eukprot:COSAG04_NODE_773_length_10423_cov_33.575165_8_plen_652_part_00